jgi:hypothetical protein
MKKSVYNYNCNGSDAKYNLSIEVLMDIPRELTKADELNLMTSVEKLVKAFHEETAKDDPELKERARKEKLEILELFGDQKIFVREIPNEYCDCYICKQMPWFVVTTDKGEIKIGWRKRVLCLSWDNSNIMNTAEELFGGENTTKYDKTIHAWGYEKAEKYIDKLLA